MSKLRQKKKQFIRKDLVLVTYGPGPNPLCGKGDAELTEDDRQGDQKTEYEVVQFQG
jgi:hypothetical protein